MKRHKRAIILGNGHTRKMVSSFSRLKTFAYVYGCNALYRDHYPHILVCIDDKMIKEVAEIGYARNHVVYCRSPKLCEFSVPIPDDPGWSCGPTATWAACTERFQEIYLVGHDFIGGTVYEGTLNYGTPTVAGKSKPHTGWVRQLFECFKAFPYVKFFQVQPETKEFPLLWRDARNVRAMLLSDFEWRVICG